MNYVYGSGGTLKNQKLVKMVFDSNLYYKNDICRTPTMNYLKIKKSVADKRKKEGLFSENPMSGE